MKGVALVLVVATSALAQPPEVTPTPPVDPKVDFKVSLVGKQNQFHVGEIIQIKLSFSSRLKRSYQINEAQYDRSGRMPYEEFVVTPAEGADDPMADYFSPDSLHMGGGLTGFSFLKTKPWTIQLNLNEWVRFTKPGEYKLRVSSSRVEMVDSASVDGTRPVTAMSDEITLKILPRDPNWEKRTLDQALAVLQEPASTKRDARGNSPALRAMETLRFLGTGDAARELAKRLRSGEGNFPSTCFFGLISSPEREIVRAALEHELADPIARLTTSSSTPSSGSNATLRSMIRLQRKVRKRRWGG